MDIWLTVWWLTFYCDPDRKMAVVSKLLIGCIRTCGSKYGIYVEKYLYSEKEIVESDKNEAAYINLPKSMAAAKPLQSGAMFFSEFYKQPTTNLFYLQKHHTRSSISHCQKVNTKKAML